MRKTYTKTTLRNRTLMVFGLPTLTQKKTRNYGLLDKKEDAKHCSLLSPTEGKGYKIMLPIFYSLPCCFLLWMVSLRSHLNLSNNVSRSSVSLSIPTHSIPSCVPLLSHATKSQKRPDFCVHNHLFFSASFLLTINQQFKEISYYQNSMIWFRFQNPFGQRGRQAAWKPHLHIALTIFFFFFWNSKLIFIMVFT